MVMTTGTDSRWELYRLLSDPLRLRVLALTAEEELTVGELSELLRQGQPNVSRHTASLRSSGLLRTRRQGTRTLVQLDPKFRSDLVVADALAAGRELCLEDGSLSEVKAVIERRDAKTREFFERPIAPSTSPIVATELPAYLMAFRHLIAHRTLAVDAGTGDGTLLDLLAPVFERVIAVDRSEAQLSRASLRLGARGYQNVELIADQLDGPKVKSAVGEGADLVVASRVLHHAPLPRQALMALVDLARPPSSNEPTGGSVMVVDYSRHEDASMQDKQADVWLGFDPHELKELALAAGLTDVSVSAIPPGFVQSEADGHVPWLSLFGSRAP